MEAKKCLSCGVNVAPGHKYCPLCGKFISEDTGMDICGYDHVDTTYVKKLVFIQVGRSASMAAVAVCLCINFFTGITNPWFFYVLASALLFNFAVLVPWERGALLWREIFIINVSVCAFVVFIDFFGSIGLPAAYRGWSVQWMLPCMLGAGTLGLVIYNVFAKTDSASSLAAILVCFLFSGIVFGVSFIMYQLPQYFNVWTALPSLIALMETFFFSVVLGWAKHKSLQKKFHI